MHTRSKLLSALATVLLALSLTAAANANRGIQVEPQNASIAFPGMVLSSSLGSITCPVTLNGSLHSTIAKARGTLAGYVTEVSINVPGCRESFGVGNVTEVSVLNVPWHMQYDEFRGTLPEITNLRTIVENTQFHLDFEILGGDARCLYRSDQSSDLPVERRRVSRAVIVTGRRISPNAGSTGNCPSGELSGTGNVTPTVEIRLLG